MYSDNSCPQQELLADLQRQVVDTLIRHKKKPYLPVWGELFCTLREMMKIGTKTKQDILIYPIWPAGSLYFKHLSGLFLIHIPDPGLTISLSTDQLIESLIEGRFMPAAPSPEKASLVSE